MCGIFAVFLSDKTAQAYPYILSGLTVLQHRGQDAAGIHTYDDTLTYKRKNVGKVDKVFDNVSPAEFPGNYGVGHVRYCTAGSMSVESAQPLDIAMHSGLEEEGIQGLDYSRIDDQRESRRELEYSRIDDQRESRRELDYSRIDDQRESRRELEYSRIDDQRESRRGLDYSRIDDQRESRREFYRENPPGSCRENEKISLVHNGNLTNTEDLVGVIKKYNNPSYPNPKSDSEILLQLFDVVLRIHMLDGHPMITNSAIICTVNVIMNLCRGSFSVAVAIRGFGLVVFRDPRGIRPLCVGTKYSGLEEGGEISKKSRRQNKRADEFANVGYAFASESVALQSVGFDLIGDVAPGECIIVTDDGIRRKSTNVATLPVATLPVATLTPCLFEYIYFARPESTIDGILVYQARKNMGEALANKILRDYPDIVAGIDVVMPVPDSARISALRASYILQKPYCEGLIKNAYVGRTFILSSQQERKKTLKMKLNTIDQEFRDKVVLVIDDSIVRGNTSIQIIEIIRKAGAKRIIFASIAPPVRHPNVYGIAIPTESELIASGNKTDGEIAALIGADMVIFNDLRDVVESCIKCNGKCTPGVREFEVSCFARNM